MNTLTDATSDKLTCRELVAVVTMYVEDALPPSERERFERHLEHCVGCQRYLVQLRRTIALTSELRENDLSEDERAVLRGVFQGWRRGDGG